MQSPYCQCCGMPLRDGLYANNADGSQNQYYCTYCYHRGAFTLNITMDQMIEACIPHMVSTHSDMTEEQARQNMKSFFPTLKRWKQV